MSAVINHVLPNELWEQIFICLDYPSVLRCQQVCRLFNDIITGSAKIQYHGELKMDGMIDTGTSELPVNGRLALLRERRFAWDNLRWKPVPDMTIPKTYRAFDFVAGIYAIVVDDHEFIAAALPTTGEEGYKKAHHLEFSVRDFCMDPTQDVIIFLGEPEINDPAIYLHVRTYSSNGPHPESEQPRILVNPLQRPHDWMLQLAGGICGLASSNQSGAVEIRIWNWKTGKQIYEQAMRAEAMVESFTLLNSQAFALGNIWRTGYISVVHVASGIEVSRLFFPERISGQIQGIEVDSSQFLACPQTNSVFMPSSTRRVHAFTLYYRLRGQVINLRAYVLNEFLLSYATSRDNLQKVPWEDWGPLNTRIIEKEPFHTSHCSSEGLRVAFQLKRGCTDLHVLDFNFHRKLSENPDNSKVVESVTSPTKISYPLIFKHTIETFLPYTLHLRAAPDSWLEQESIIILGDSHIVAIANDSSPTDNTQLRAVAISI